MFQPQLDFSSKKLWGLSAPYRGGWLPIELQNSFSRSGSCFGPAKGAAVRPWSAEPCKGSQRAPWAGGLCRWLLASFSKAAALMLCGTRAAA